MKIMVAALPDSFTWPKQVSASGMLDARGCLRRLVHYVQVLIDPLGANPHSETSPKVNHHPTVKPLKLMTYLIRMVTPPNGIVLDPFCGSGSTGVAAGRDGFKFLGIENDPEYVQIARHRFANEMSLSEDEITSLEGEEEIPDGDLSLNDSSQ
jgi:DNA modification methylase